MEEEKSYKLTESGAAEAVELLGGQDVANVLQTFMHLLKSRGDAFGTKITGEDEPIRLWLQLTPLVQVIKKCKNWESLVVSCEKLLEEETDFFERNPHSDFYPLGGLNEPSPYRPD